MKKICLPLLVVVFLLLASFAEARPGGGRSSSGSRGSRGSFSGSSRYQPTRPAPEREAYRSQPSPQPFPSQPGGGGFLRNFGAGLAGGFLGSMLFRGLGGGHGYGGGGGIGLLEILLFAGLGYLLYRWFKNRTTFQAAGPTDYSRTPSPWQSHATPVSDTTFDAPTQDDADRDVASVLAQHNPGFNLPRFKEARIDDFFRIQAAFMNRDLPALRNLMGPELYKEIERDLNELAAKGQVNRLENITIRETDVVEAWQEPGRELATVRVLANALDYVADERTGAVITGSKTEPVKFEEYWTFARDTNSVSPNTGWVLSGIDQGQTA